MNWLEVFSSSVFTTAGMGALMFMSRDWFSTRLKESIAAEYREAMERFKQSLAWEDRRKQQAVEIAELFSLWMRHHYYPEEDANHVRYDLQKKYWELALWLDAPALRAVHKAFNSAQSPGVAHKEALVEVRKIIAGAGDTIAPGELFHFDALKPAD